MPPTILADDSRTTDVQELKDRLKQIKALSLMSKEETLRMRLKHVGPSVTLFFQESPLKMVQGRGQYMYDELGNEYLDCINNVSHVGHGNRRVAEAIGRQISLLNTNSRFLHDNLSLYAKRLVSLFPAHLSVCYFVNSGSEANDLAIRLARAYTKKKDIVSVDGAYHGNLTSTMAISPYKTDKLIDYKRPKWAHVAPLPCAYRGQFNRDQFGVDSPPEATNETIGRLYGSATRRMIEELQEKRGRQVAAFFVESMISCGGQMPLPSGYLRYLQKHLRQLGVLLVCDEVQTGFGRSGKRMWAFQLQGEDIEPDIVTMGKPMGNGFPISAVITRPEVAQAFKEIGTEYFNTFGGSPASCAAALAVLDEMEDRKLMNEANRIGSYIMHELKSLKSKSSYVGDVRGCGFFIGLELVENLKSKTPAPKHAQFIIERFREERILFSTEGKFGNVLKFKPPMVFTMSDAQRFVRVLEKSLVDLEAQLMDSANGLDMRPLTTNVEVDDKQTNHENLDQRTSKLITSAVPPSLSSSSSSRSSTSSSSWLESSVELDP